MTINTYCGR